MVALRSLLFHVLFVINTLAWMILCLPLLAAPRQTMIGIAKAWVATNLSMLRTICGIRLEVRGREHIPTGGALVAAKHQSTFETYALFALLPDPTFILKRELVFLPLFGWYLWKVDSIAIDRDAGARTLRAMAAATRRHLDLRRQVVIFPEGTRRSPGAAPDYKPGIALLYASANAPCVPVALNSGLFWARRSFLRHPGTVVIEFLPPIPPGLSRADVMSRLREVVESASDRLANDTRAGVAR